MSGTFYFSFLPSSDGWPYFQASPLIVVKLLPDCTHKLFTGMYPQAGSWAFLLVILLLVRRTTFSRNPPGDFSSGPINWDWSYAPVLASWEAEKTTFGMSSPLPEAERRGKGEGTIIGWETNSVHPI